MQVLMVAEQVLLPTDPSLQALNFGEQGWWGKVRKETHVISDWP